MKLDHRLIIKFSVTKTLITYSDNNEYTACKNELGEGMYNWGTNGLIGSL